MSYRTVTVDVEVDIDDFDDDDIRDEYDRRFSGKSQSPRDPVEFERSDLQGLRMLMLSGKHQKAIERFAELLLDALGTAI
jgi:hypothetical protein